MKFILKSFAFLGIFTAILFSFGFSDVSAATSSNCIAAYTGSGVIFNLFGNPPLPPSTPISLEFASTESNVGLGQDITLTPDGNGGFQGNTVSISSPTTVYYRFMLDGQQYCPPSGVKSLTTNTTTQTTTTTGAGASPSPTPAPEAGSNPQSCPSGQVWNVTLNTCAPVAQTVGGTNPNPTPGANPNPTPGTNPNPTPETNPNPTPEGGDPGISNPRLINPLGGVDSIEGFLEKLFNIVLRIAIPIIALAIIYSGFLFVTAQGKEDKLTTAKSTLLYTLIGAAIILGAWVIANALSKTVEDIRNDVGIQIIKDIA